LKNKLFDENCSFSYDDLLLKPQLSDIKSRSEIDISTHLGSFKKNIAMGIPIIASPMQTICEEDMQNAFAEFNSFGIIHRYCSIPEQAATIKKCGGDKIAFATGATGDYMERAIEGVKAGANIICVDVANGYNTMIKEAIRNIKIEFGDDVFIIGGNVACSDGFNFLADLGLSGIRVGVGGGSRGFETRRQFGDRITMTHPAGALFFHPFKKAFGLFNFELGKTVFALAGFLNVST